MLISYLLTGGCFQQLNANANIWSKVSLLSFCLSLCDCRVFVLSETWKTNLITWLCCVFVCFVSQDGYSSQCVSKPPTPCPISPSLSSYHGEDNGSMSSAACPKTSTSPVSANHLFVFDYDITVSSGLADLAHSFKPCCNHTWSLYFTSFTQTFCMQGFYWKKQHCANIWSLFLLFSTYYNLKSCCFIVNVLHCNMIFYKFTVRLI